MIYLKHYYIMSNPTTNTPTTPGSIYNLQKIILINNEVGNAWLMKFKKKELLKCYIESANTFNAKTNNKCIYDRNQKRKLLTEIKFDI